MKPMTPALRESLLTVFFSAVVLLLAIACHGGGFLHWESSAFLLNYIADRPLPAIIFDPLKNDWGLYQCRELSYFFDYLDAQIIYMLLKSGVCWFVSCSAILFSLLGLWFQQYAGRLLFPRLPGIFFTLHGMALALLPAIAGSIFFRSSKFAVFAGLTFLIFGTALKCIRKKTVFSSNISCCLAAFITVFADRQGVYFVTAFTGILAVMQLFDHRRVFTRIIRLCGAAVVVGVIADLWIMPWIIQVINHYQVDFSYQGSFAVDSSLFFKGLRFFAANCGHTFAGQTTIVSATAAGMLFLFVSALILLKKKNFPCWLFPGSVVTAVICCGIMVLRHPPLLHEDIIFSNYFLPSAAILTFFYFAALENLPERLRKFCWLVPLLILVFRLYPYLHPEMLCREDKYQKVYQDATVKLKQAVENPGENKIPPLIPYRMEKLLEKLNHK